MDKVEWVDWVKHLLFVIIPGILGIWKITDAWVAREKVKAEQQSKRDREFVTQVVKEVMESAFGEVRSDIKELKDIQRQDTRSINERIDKLVGKT